MARVPHVGTLQVENCAAPYYRPVLRLRFDKAFVERFLAQVDMPEGWQEYGVVSRNDSTEREYTGQDLDWHYAVPEDPELTEAVKNWADEKRFQASFNGDPDGELEYLDIRAMDVLLERELSPLMPEALRKAIEQLLLQVPCSAVGYSWEVKSRTSITVQFKSLTEPVREADRFAAAIAKKLGNIFRELMTAA